MNILGKMISDNRVYSFMSLYPGKNAEEVRKQLSSSLRKRLLVAVPVVLFAVLLFFINDLRGDRKGPAVIEREDVNGGALRIPVFLRNESGEHEAFLNVSPLKMTESAIDIMQKEVCSVLDGIVPGDNPSFDLITSDLVFPEEIDGFPVAISWTTSAPGLVQTDGRVLNEALDRDTRVSIWGKVSYGEEFRLYERELAVAPRELSGEEKETGRQMESLALIERETAYERTFTLPDSVDGATVSLKKEDGIPGTVKGLLLGSILLIVVWSAFYSSLNDKKKERFLEAERDCKEFLSKLSILLAAGLPMRSSWKKMTEDLEASGKKGMLYENMAVTLREFMNGNPENTAYERFGERMEITRYQRIAAVLSQSVTKGVSELPEILSTEIREAVADEREQIRIRGEQAGTKLLIPMMGFLTIVFAILLVPAFKTF